MSIKRGWTIDPINKVDRTVTAVSLSNADIKDATDIVNPSLIVNVPAASKTDYYTKTNMIYIDAFKRWYNVDNIEFENANRVVYKCSCDVLKTFADDIKSNSFYVSRQENNFDEFIADSQLPKKNSYGSPVCTEYTVGWTPNSYSYVVQIVGGVINGAVRTYIMDETTYHAMVEEFFGITQSTVFNADPASNVIAAVKIPLSVSSLASVVSAVSVQSIFIGNSTITVPSLALCYGVVGKPVATVSDITVTFDTPFDDWRDFENLYHIYVPYCGEMSVNGAEVFEDGGMGFGVGTYHVKTTLDIVTGDVCTMFYQKSLVPIPELPAVSPKWVLRGNCAINAPVSGNNASNLISSAGSLITTIAGAATGNAVALSAGISSLMSTPKQISYTAGMRNGSPAWDLPQSISVTRNVHGYANATNYGATYGRPSHKTITGLSLSGFTVCDNVQMTWGTTPVPTTAEKENVKSLLESGVIF